MTMYEATNPESQKTNFWLRLIKTTSFRFALITVSLFMVSVTVLGAISYRATIGAAIAGVEEQIDSEFENLQKIYALSGFVSLRGTIGMRASRQNRLLFNPYSSDSLYIFINARTKQSVIRDLEEVPAEALKTNKMVEFEYRRDRKNLDNSYLDPEEYETRYAIGRLERFVNPVTGEPEAVIFLARDISDLVNIRTSARGVIYQMTIGTLFLGLVLAFFSSRAFLVRIDRVNKTAEAIRAGDLSKRIQLAGADDEFDSLSQNLNMMLDQIERLMLGMRQVSDNIAHDLRSPLTRIRNRVEDALNADDADLEAVLDKTSIDIDRLLATFNALLSITRIESGERAKGRMQKVDLKQVLAEVLELYEPAAEDAGFIIDAHIEPTPYILGSRELISQAIANLLDNAFKYAVPEKGATRQGRIEVSLKPRMGGGALLSVEDNGPGVPVAERDRILNRFVRLEQSRSTHGSGLGLSMVSAIVRFHRGQLSVGDGLAYESLNNEGEEVTKHGLGLRIALPEPSKKMLADLENQSKSARNS